MKHWKLGMGVVVAVMLALLLGSIGTSTATAQGGRAELWGYITLRQPLTGNSIPINSGNVTVRVDVGGRSYQFPQTFSRPWYYAAGLPTGVAQVRVLWNGLWHPCPGAVTLRAGSTQFNCRIG